MGCWDFSTLLQVEILICWSWEDLTNTWICFDFGYFDKCFEIAKITDWKRPLQIINPMKCSCLSELFRPCARIIWLVVSNTFYVHPYLGKWSNLTNIFQRGWNHQLVILFYPALGSGKPFFDDRITYTEHARRKTVTAHDLGGYWLPWGMFSAWQERVFFFFGSSIQF